MRGEHHASTQNLVNEGVLPMAIQRKKLFGTHLAFFIDNVNNDTLSKDRTHPSNKINQLIEQHETISRHNVHFPHFRTNIFLDVAMKISEKESKSLVKITLNVFPHFRSVFRARGV